MPDANGHTRFGAELEAAALRGGVRMYYFWYSSMLPRAREGSSGSHLHSTCTGIGSPLSRVPLSGPPLFFQTGNKKTS